MGMQRLMNNAANICRASVDWTSAARTCRRRERNSELNQALMTVVKWRTTTELYYFLPCVFCFAVSTRSHDGTYINLPLFC